MEALEAELKDIESNLGIAGDDIKPPLKKKNATIPRTPLVVTPSRNEENLAGALIGAAEAADEVLGSERERQRRAHEVKIEMFVCLFILLILQHTAGFCSNSLFYPVVHCVLRFLFFF